MVERRGEYLIAIANHEMNEIHPHPPHLSLQQRIAHSKCRQVSRSDWLSRMQKFLWRVNYHRRPASRNTIREPKQQRFARVVRDENDSFPETFLHISKFLLEFSAGKRIERAERLVHQENRRIGSESPSDADALTLAAGELVRVSVCEFCRCRVQSVEATPLHARALRSSGHLSSHGTSPTLRSTV